MDMDMDMDMGMGQLVAIEWVQYILFRRGVTRQLAANEPNMNEPQDSLRSAQPQASTCGFAATLAICDGGSRLEGAMHFATSPSLAAPKARTTPGSSRLRRLNCAANAPCSS